MGLVTEEGWPEELHKNCAQLLHKVAQWLFFFLKIVNVKRKQK
jgi:hypothetical protein